MVLDNLQKMLGYFSANEQQNLQLCADKLLNQFQGKALSEQLVFVAYGGGKDSSYMLAYVRILQLSILKKHGATFNMRVASNRHVGMPQAVMENIHRVYLALELYDDPTVELLLIDHNTVAPFDKDKPIPAELKQKNRDDMLMAGHRTQGDGRPTFCNACNLSMVNSFWLASIYQRTVDVIITGDSTQEQKDYYLWVKRLSREYVSSSVKVKNGFRSFIQATKGISDHYFSEIYGEIGQGCLNRKGIQFETSHMNIKGMSPIWEPKFFSIYDYTQYAAGEHWDFLTEFLSFEFDDLAFSFTETDCANPAVMAHLRGLKAEQVFQRSYDEGIIDYIKLAFKLMKDKKFPDQLVIKVLTRYLSNGGMKTMRDKIQQFVDQAYNLSETQLICLVFSPFYNQGERLESYLSTCCPDLLPQINTIRHLLANQPAANSNSLVKRLKKLSGLSLNSMRFLFNSSKMNTRSKKTIIQKILHDDPHKATIETHHSAQGESVLELISGR